MKSGETKRISSQGFTLVELLVSLVAGLIVALAVVALSKNATQTFYEEQRAASAEMSLRIAIDRLRQDVQRASFMASGNIQADTFVPLVASNPTKVSATAPVGLANLAGIQLEQHGSMAGTPLSQAGGNSFPADAIRITGNFTTTDQYAVQSVTAGGCGQQFNLSTKSAAWYRVATSPDPAASLAQMFNPIIATNPNARFMARISDDLGRFQYAIVCSTGIAGTTPFVGIDPATPVDITQYGFVDGRLTINPVQTVRWAIMQLPAATYPQYAPLDPGAGQPDKYDLVRQWVDSTGAVVGSPELVSEYAVDLRFAFTADIGTYFGAVPAPSMIAWQFDAVENQSIAPFNGLNPLVQPQRIRSVRIRLSTRSPFGDRGQPLSAPDGYQMRYCTKIPCATGTDSKDFARMRTLSTEVSLPNQARLFY